MLCERQINRVGKYIAAETDTTAQVSKVENGVIYNNHKTDGGYIILDNGVCVEYSKDDLDMVFDLKKSDVVHAKGVIFYIDSQGIKVMNNNTNYHFPSGYVLSPQKASIEKL